MKTLEILNLIMFGFPEVLGGPGGSRRLRDACRINFHLSWYLIDFMVPSYDQKTGERVKNLVFLG